MNGPEHVARDTLHFHEKLRSLWLPTGENASGESLEGRAWREYPVLPESFTAYSWTHF